jgi:predicted GNAT family acetyltransferase
MLFEAEEKDFSAVAALAREIWYEHYDRIVPKNQIEYMLENFQSEKAIKNQVKEGYMYVLFKESSGEITAYAAAKSEKTKIFLSKLYVKKEYRKKGIASRLISFISEKFGTKNMYLTVNKNNKSSIAAYKRLGFSVADCAVTDIGGGFFMDDYIMEN